MTLRSKCQFLSSVALMSTGFVSAQGLTPTAPQTPGSGYGRGGAMNGGILHDGMIAVYAAKQAIQAGALTQEQTDWMNTRGQRGGMQNGTGT